MKRDRMLVLAVAVALGACNAPKPNIREGDAERVEVNYGGDVATAWPLARKHCAQYERVPRLTDTAIGENGLDMASFDCIQP
jgi:hypothetical protein